MHHALFFPLQRRMGKKAEVPETVINCHHHRAALRQRPAVIRRQPASAEGKAPPCSQTITGSGAARAIGDQTLR